MLPLSSEIKRNEACYWYPQSRLHGAKTQEAIASTHAAVKTIDHTKIEDWLPAVTTVVLFSRQCPDQPWDPLNQKYTKTVSQEVKWPEGETGCLFYSVQRFRIHGELYLYSSVILHNIRNNWDQGQLQVRFCSPNTMKSLTLSNTCTYDTFTEGCEVMCWRGAMGRSLTPSPQEWSLKVLKFKR